MKKMYKERKFQAKMHFSRKIKIFLNKKMII